MMVVKNIAVVMMVVENIAVVMIVGKKIVVEYFLDSSNFGSRIVVVDDTPIVIDKLIQVTFAFQKKDTVARKNLSLVNLGDEIWDFSKWRGRVVWWRGMSSTSSVLDTTSRLAQWCMDDPFHSEPLQSPSFKIGEWDWTLALVKNQKIFVLLIPKACDQGPPIASFNMRLASLVEGRETLAHVEIRDKQLQLSEDFIVLTFDGLLTRSFMIEVEFLDLKTTSPKNKNGRKEEKKSVRKRVENKKKIRSFISPKPNSSVFQIPGDFTVGSLKKDQENDKIGSKPNKNGKRGEAGKCQKQLQ
nr:hypothetical protein [Tanacetum cinerariifolium]